jgi:hypothetical protein
MSHPAEQNFPPGDIKAVTALYTEGHTDYGDKQQQQAVQVPAFPLKQFWLSNIILRFIYKVYIYIYNPNPSGSKISK